MWRAIFLALGIVAMIIGMECLTIHSAVLYDGKHTAAVDFVDPTGAPSSRVKEWRPKEWLPWALLSGGAITVIYAFALPKRFRRAKPD